MPDDYLGNMQFHSDAGGELSPEEFIDLMHDPDILYYYIQDAYAKVQGGLEVDADGKEGEVQVHAQVEVFQSAMQYVEAFGIYLLSYIKGREDLLEYLIRTDPGELKQFFKELKDDNLSDYFDEYDVDDDYQTVLETIFGYMFVEHVERTDGDEEVTEEEIEEAIEQSVDVLDAQIRRVGEFYLYFGDIYNAVKHGNRVLPQIQNEFQINSDEVEIDVDLDMDFVIFVCKNQNGKPFITGVPIDYLIDHSLEIVEKVHRLFTHLKRISHAAINDEEFEVSFFRFEESDEDEDSTPEWIMATHSSGVIILPRTEELDDLEEPIEWKFAGRVEIDHQTLRIRTQHDTEISDAYPISVSILQRGTVGLSPQPIMGLNFQFTVNDLDVVQYLEYLHLQDLVSDGDGVNTVTLVDEQSDREIETGTPEDFDISEELEDLLSRERMGQLYWLQKITGRRIPVPLALSDEQLEVLDECIEQDLTEDLANEAVDRLDELGEGRTFTELYVDKMMPGGEIVESELIDALPGRVSFGFRDEETGEEGEVTEVRMPSRRSINGYEELIEELENDPSEINEIIEAIPASVGAAHSGPPSGLYVHSKKGEPGFWFTKDTLRFQVVDWSQGAHPPIACDLCGEYTTDIQMHLAEMCEPSLLPDD